MKDSLKFFKLINSSTNFDQIALEDDYYILINPISNLEYFKSLHVLNYEVRKIIMHYFFPYIFAITPIVLAFIMGFNYLLFLVAISVISYFIWHFSYDRKNSDIKWKIKGFMISKEKRFDLYIIYSNLRTYSRFCYDCNKELDLFHFLQTNYSFFMRRSISKLMNIWNNLLIELFCCNCFDMKKKH